MTTTEEFTLRPRVQAFLASGRMELLIDGDWLPASEGATFTTIDPATGTTLAEVARGTAPDVDRAVRAAKAALSAGPWHDMRPADRGALLWRIADLMTDHLDDLAQLETLDQGKSLRTSRFGEVPAAINQFRYYAGWPTKILGETIPTSLSRTPAGKEVFAYTRREPVGVVGAIVPWNSPLIMTAMKLAPALAAGCTIVLKPAENTPLTAIYLGQLLQEAGVPDGVVNIVTDTGTRRAGAGGASGCRQDRLHRVDRRRQTPRAVGRHASGPPHPRTRRQVAVDHHARRRPAAAIEGVSRGIFDNGGQVCVASARIYAHRDVYADVIAGMAAFGDGLNLGHGLAEGTDLGPLVSKAQADRVAGYVDEGRAEGAHVVSGGIREGDTFYTPTVLTDVTRRCVSCGKRSSAPSPS